MAVFSPLSHWTSGAAAGGKETRLPIGFASTAVGKLSRLPCIWMGGVRAWMLMPAEIESYSPGESRHLSPLRRAMFGEGRQDLDAWLAGMNAVALSFLLVASGALLPTAVASWSQPSLTPLVPQEEAMAVEMAVEPGPAAAEPAAAELESAVAEPEEPLDLPPPAEPVPYRELPELIDAVAVVEPVPAVREAPRPAREAAPPAPRTPRRSASGSEAATSARASGGAGVPGGEPGSSGTGAGAGNSAGRGTTPQPPYPAFARRDKLQGTVVVSISVNDGAVTGVRLISSSGSAALDRYAISHVQRRWKWPAGTTRLFTQPFRFVLQ